MEICRIDQKIELNSLELILDKIQLDKTSEHRIYIDMIRKMVRKWDGSGKETRWKWLMMMMN